MKCEDASRAHVPAMQTPTHAKRASLYNEHYVFGQYSFGVGPNY